MKTISAIAVLGILMPCAAMADNVGTCGWGAKLFDGQRGAIPQILAITTNGTSGSQTFGITSGTSGCTQDGVVKSSWRTAAYIDGNMNRLARDMSRGQGESLSALADLLSVPSSQQAQFNGFLQQHFAEIFPAADASSTQVVTGLRQAMSSDASFNAFASNV